MSSDLTDEKCRELAENALEAGHAALRGYRRYREAAPHGMCDEPLVLRTLTLLDEASAPQSSAELASSAGVTGARMTSILRALERRGLVRRDPDAAITDAGRAEVAEHRRQLTDATTRFARLMGEKDMRSLARLLAKAALVMDEMSAEDR